MVLVHYYNHLKENNRLDFTYFISSHYRIEGDGISSDDREEKQMPFMQHNVISINVGQVSLSELSLLPPSAFDIKTEYPVFQQVYIPDNYSLSLLRPPISLS